MTPPIDTTAGDLPARRALAHVSDDDLVGRLVGGDGDALAELYDRHGGVAYGLALRIVRTAEAAEDVVQDAFLAVQRGAATFDPRRAPARAWLLLTVRSRALDRLRREGRRPTVELDDERDGAAGGAPDAGAEALRSLEAQRVRAALATLPEDDRRLLELAYFGGRSQSEIAAQLGLPLGTVKRRTFNALAQLRTLLSNELR